MSFWDLFVAVKDGSTEEVLRLVTTLKVDVRAKDWDDRQVMHMAANYGHGEIMDILLEKGADKNCKDKWGISPLHEACMNNHSELAIRLLDVGADLSAKNLNDESPLDLASPELRTLLIERSLKSVAWEFFHASKRGDIETVKHLISGGRVDVNVQDWDDRACLHLAAEYGNEALCIYFLQIASIKVNIKDKWDITPLHEACKHDRQTIAVVLVEAGGDMFSRDSKDKSPLDLATPELRKLLLEKLDLRNSALRGDLESVQQIIDNNNVDPDEEDAEGNTALMYAAQAGHEKVAKFLLDQGCKKDAQNHRGETALHFSAGAPENTVLVLLVESGAVVDRRSEDGKTPLYLALANRCQRNALLLLARGARFNPQEPNFRQLMLDAVKENKTDLFDWLQECGVRLYDAVLRDLLHEACRVNANQIAHMCVEYGCNVNITDSEGRTPLHIAAENGHDMLVRMLVEDWNAQVGALDSSKRTPLARAAKKHHTHCSLILIRNGAVDDWRDEVFSKLLLASVEQGDIVCAGTLIRCGVVVTREVTKVVEMRVEERGVEISHTSSDLGKSRGVGAGGGALSGNLIRNFYSAMLLRSAEQGKATCVNMLLRNGVEATYLLEDGSTALHLASANGHEGVVECLVMSGAMPKIDQRTNGGYTALHLACISGHEAVVRMLVEKGRADVSLTDSSQRSPLILAVVHRHLSVVKYLTQIDEIDCLAKDDGGMNAFDHALVMSSVERLQRRALRYLHRNNGIRHNQVAPEPKVMESGAATGATSEGGLPKPSAVEYRRGAEIVRALMTVPQVTRMRQTFAIHAAYRQSVLYMAALLLITIVVLFSSTNNSNSVFNFHNAVQHMMVRASLDDHAEGSFFEPTNYDEFWESLTEEIANMYTPTDEKLSKLYEDSSGSARAFQTPSPFEQSRFLILGTVRLRQLRVRPDSCSVRPPLNSIVTRCYSLFSSGSELTAISPKSHAASLCSHSLDNSTGEVIPWDLSDYGGAPECKGRRCLLGGGGGAPSSSSSGSSDSSYIVINKTLISEKTQKAFLYRTSQEMAGDNVLGILGNTYTTGGYVLDLPTDWNTAHAVLSSLHDLHWIDLSSSAIIMEFAVYNGNLDIMCVTRVIYEFLPSGGITKSIKQRYVNIVRMTSPRWIFIIAVQCLILVYVVVDIVRKAHQFLGEGLAYFKRFSAYYDMLLHALWIAALASMVQSYLELKNVSLEQRVGQPYYFDFQLVAMYWEQQRQVISVILILMWMRTLKFVKMLPVSGPHVQAVASTFASPSVFTFVGMFIIVLIAFALAFNESYGSDVDMFRTFQLSLTYVFMFTIKEYRRYMRLKMEKKEVIGPFLITMYLVIGTMVLLNLFIAIFSDEYASAQEKCETLWNHQISQLMRSDSRIQAAANKVFSKTPEATAEHESRAQKRQERMDRALNVLHIHPHKHASENESNSAAPSHHRTTASTGENNNTHNDSRHIRMSAAVTEGSGSRMAGEAWSSSSENMMQGESVPWNSRKKVLLVIKQSASGMLTVRKTVQHGLRQMHRSLSFSHHRQKRKNNAAANGTGGKHAYDSDDDAASQHSDAESEDGFGEVKANHSEHIAQGFDSEELDLTTRRTREDAAKKKDTELSTEEELERAEKHLTMLKTALEARLHTQNQKIGEMKRNLEKLAYVQNDRIMHLSGRLMEVAGNEKRSVGKLQSTLSQISVNQMEEKKKQSQGLKRSPTMLRAQSFAARPQSKSHLPVQDSLPNMTKPSSQSSLQSHESDSEPNSALRIPALNAEKRNSQSGNENVPAYLRLHQDVEGSERRQSSVSVESTNSTRTGPTLVGT